MASENLPLEERRAWDSENVGWVTNVGDEALRLMMGVEKGDQ